MTTDRKEFLKIAGMGGLGLLAGEQNTKQPPFLQYHKQQFNMHGYAAPALETVRVGFIGIGGRGSSHVQRFSRIEGVEIKALCDLHANRVDKSIKSIQEHIQDDPDAYYGGGKEWKKVCERDDIDLIIISTPWKLHAPMAAYAMEQSKHVGVEVPAAISIEECWQLVEISERTQKHCMMLENVNYDSFELLTLNMARQGFFGQIIHGEGAYIHDRVNSDTRWDRDKEDHNQFGFAEWRLQANVNRNGNLYPTHGLGPISNIMDLNYGDQMDYMVSISSDDFTLTDKMEEVAKQDDYFESYAGLNYRGNMNTSIIRTQKGRTIMLQHDVSSPRPYSRIHLISGTHGVARKYPLPGRIANSHEGWLSEAKLNALKEKYTPNIITKVSSKAQQIGGHGGMDTVMTWRMIDCLRNGLPLDMDVYDAALLSAVGPLSEWSVARGGKPVNVPDFTAGAWKTNKPGMDISLDQGGTTKIV